ncbi:helix-turn-helix domain-containing protein [Sporosarcina jiandibaonis]|uniref:helix-turn-helix domain-containing protein n=1 Tax=Sporosarcina jiandibaonis TaxID=2715535 RepID=UPI001FE79133|nr:helix-turn-helix transcriptional regulator [Sporosarcina jiandibaonis]
MERKLVKQLRLKHNLTQQQLAEKLDLSTVYVRKIEKGVVNAGLPTMIKYENLFGVNMRTLFPDIFFEANDNEFIKKKKTSSS